MADTRAFNVYYANRTVLPGEVPIAGDEFLVLRGGTVYRMPAAAVFAYAATTDNSDVTAIATQDVWVDIAGTLVEGVASANFSFATNQFTYNGINQAAPALLKAKMSTLRIGGGDDNYEVGLFVNDVQLGSGMIAGCGNSLAGYAQTENTHTFQTGDIIEMKVRNTTGTADCIV
ncbi:unnamed protein product, partial [marine sediment metagenome]